MEPSIFKYILKHSLRGQVLLLVMTAISLPIVYVSLEIPKIIVNQALGDEGIPEAVLGMPMDRVTYLWLLCFLFLALVVLNGGLKYVINVYQGVLGERMLRRLRFELYSRMQRFPLPHFKRVSQGEILPMIIAETEPLGGFIGESFVVPAMQGGIVLTYMFFIFNQDLWLGLAAIALYPFQIWLIPRLQKRVNELSRRRVRTVRRLSDRVGEGVSGITEIHAHDTSHFERADISHRLGRIFTIRFGIYRRKYLIKFLNNFIAQLTPFFFYAIGGYFVIQGELSLGALVAVLAAYKDLTSPWKEILRYYEIKEDIRVKYGQIVEQFQPAGMYDPALLDTEPEEPVSLAGDISTSNLSYSEDESVKNVDAVSLKVAEGEHVALVGLGASGKDELSRLLARLVFPTTGRISIAGKHLAELPESVTGRRLSYVGQNAFIFSGSVLDNLFYGLKHRPRGEARFDDEEEAARRRRDLEEARKAGSPTDDILADWIDYRSAGVEGYEALRRKAIALMPVVDMESDIYQLGLNGTVDPEAEPELAARLLEARADVRKQLEDPTYAKLVEPFDLARFNSNMSVAENLLFGTPKDDSIDPDNIVSNPYVRKVLHETGIMSEFLQRGYKLAEIMLDLFADVSPEDELFEQFSFIDADDVPVYQRLVAHVREHGLDDLPSEDKTLLRSLPFKLVPARHRVGIVDAELEQRLLEARRMFAQGFGLGAPPVEFFDPEAYHPAISIQDNILFGKLVYGQAQAQARVGTLVRDTIERLGLHDELVQVGLHYEVGIAGARLGFALRQKLAIARALIKNPDVLIFNEASGALDTRAEAQLLAAVREHMSGRGLVAVVGRPDLARDFDRVLVMENGKLVEQGPAEELERAGTAFQELVHAT